VEDEVEVRRGALIAAPQKRLHRASRNQSLFLVRWGRVHVPENQISRYVGPFVSPSLKNSNTFP